MEKGKLIKVLDKTKTSKYDKILKVMGGISDEIKKGKLSKEEKVELKSYAIKKAVKIRKNKARRGLEIEIIETNEIEGGVEVFARAWRDGKQIGFGKDGTVDIERFRIFNPPILVEDTRGDISRTSVDDEGVVTTLTFREDPEEAIIKSIEQTIFVKKQVFSNKNIIRGKTGNTTSTLYPAAGANAPCDGDNMHDTNATGGSEAFTFFRAQTESTSNNVTNSANQLKLACSVSNGSFFRFYAFLGFGFDTSVIDTDSIDSAVFSVKRASAPTTTLGACDVDLVAFNPASDNTFVSGDYDGYGLTRFATGVDLGGIGTDYTDWTLNASGIAHIDKSANTFFSLQLEWFVDNVFGGTGVANQRNQLNTQMADTAGTTNDPKLVVEHSAGSPVSQTARRGVVMMG